MGSSKQGVEPHQIILGFLGGSAKLRIAPDLILPDTTFLDTTFLHRNTATPLNYEIPVQPQKPTSGSPLTMRSAVQPQTPKSGVPR